ncbi:unnamed protein product [Notodromas monacha]|uniref:Condensation domain-containing protein n=1 Tax=Notodromas monacha TaxID=399045 RepID=A0A7R9BXL0_9CRUS|nr:unnamed protein product [Notodromas monacha]CAG0922093.1 unnamed protein product [Notodromas monacha]
MQKVQHLRLAIQDDGYQRFFVELRNPEIVFKNCGSREWRDLFEEMLGIEYDAENGPLWQARVTRMGREDEASCQIVNGCVNHGYVLLIGFHHSITDGTSNAKFCTILLKIVNALLTTGSVPEGDEVTLAPSMWDLTSPEHMQKFRVYDPRDLLSLAKDCYNYGFNERSQYLRRFPPPKNMFHSEIRSGIVTAELTTEITTELIRACKRKGVTVSGAFTAAAGIAIYNLITRPEGPTPALPKGKRKFGINHAVNLRRYFDKSNQDACGCYFNFFDDHVTCDENSLARFWEVAHEATISIHQNVDNARGLKKQRNLDFIFNYLYPSDWYCSWRRRRALHSANSEFSTSNLGAVDKMFNGVGTPVETIKMFRSTAMHYLPSLFTWFFQTFRGRFTGLLEFFTNFVTRQQAQDYIDETMRVLIAGIDLARLPSSTELMTSEVIAR